MQFQILSPKKVIFGCGERHQLGAAAASLGKNALLISGSRSLKLSPHWTDLLASLTTHQVRVVHEFQTVREPTVEDIDDAISKLNVNSEPLDCIIAIGGGAAIDFGKALAAMITNQKEGSIRDFLEGVGTGRTPDALPLPLIAVPTTAGTGSEATKNAVISVTNPDCKKSIRSEALIPEIVIIDPELTVSAPSHVTAASGMDAITQLIESYISKRANPLTQALCLEGLKHAIPNLERAYQDGTNIEARSAMSYAAYLSGIALANSGLGMAHGIAAALGAVCNVPHGMACASLLPIALKTNQTTSRKEQVVLGKLFSRNPHLSKADAIAISISHIESMCDALAIPRRLRDLGVQQDQIPAIAAGSRGNSMNGNPRELTDSELITILEENW